MAVDKFTDTLFSLRARISIAMLRHDASLCDRETHARNIAALHRSASAELQRLKDESDADALKWDRAAVAENGKRRGETQLTIMPPTVGRRPGEPKRFNIGSTPCRVCGCNPSESDEWPNDKDAHADTCSVYDLCRDS